MKFNFAFVLAALLSLFPAVLTQAQQPAPAGDLKKLSELLAEAERNNPQIQAARHGWDSAKQSPTQVSTLPDPQFVLQQSIHVFLPSNNFFQ